MTSLIPTVRTQTAFPGKYEDSLYLVCVRRPLYTGGKPLPHPSSTASIGSDSSIRQTFSITATASAT